MINDMEYFVKTVAQKWERANRCKYLGVLIRPKSFALIALYTRFAYLENSIVLTPLPIPSGKRTDSKMGLN